MNRKKVVLYLTGIGLLLALALAWYARAFVLKREAETAEFNAERAYADVQTQVAFGPRTPGSEAHARLLEWLRGQLEAAGWQVEIQQAEALGHPIRNVVAYRTKEVPRILLAAHYDSRLYASRDPDPHKWTEPVPGANDGASGVAVLLELARILPEETVPLWLVFFDAEDNGDIPGWDWLLGSRAFVAQMQVRPEAMLLVDMVGDPDLSLPMEGNSDVALRTSIWETAAALGYEKIFIPQVRYTVQDDHVPFLEAGVPAADIIDLEYPYWHTTSDTPEHVSARSLQIVGEVLLTWLTSMSHPNP